ncbi:YafY family protein [Amycolatopsis sp. YIM 10]|uniref:helix-turn-helix transcriptional regulator n=1 Tax=Amycolatopsis sp. YIM 10 TaxID=2653857 RepID=UPI00128FDD1E|nr:YafY family protein [Amycolatopsis sp. YIM 10]QFU90074.1 Bifunctional ligase/repressor BirA [Amycolatopsis sp. YIM 10]
MTDAKPATARLLSLLSLLQTPREWPGSELAGRLGVSPRTIRRDIDRLRDLGYPVEATMGADGGYRLVAGAAIPPLLLDDEEAVAIALGLRTAAGNAITGIEEASVRALTKLEQVLPSRLRYRVGALSGATVPALTPGTQTVDPAVLTVIAAAVTNRERLRFSYLTNEGADGKRHTEPHRLVSAGRRWYLVAFDLDRDDWRIYRADRIRDPLATGARAQPRELPAEDAATYLTSKMYSLVPTYQAEATLHLPIEQARTRLGDAGDHLEAIDEHSCRLHGYGDTLEWLASRLVMLGCEFEVHGPPELIAHLREISARVTRGVGCDGEAGSAVISP